MVFLPIYPLFCCFGNCSELIVVFHSLEPHNYSRVLYQYFTSEEIFS